ncbi:MAG: hypothetical protein ACRETZ_15475, partial [Steroidobacteraceae bacterium]
RRGQRSEVAERIRERYRERVATRERAALPESKPGPEATAALDMEARRRQAVQDWLKYRAEKAQQANLAASAEHAPPETLEDLRRRAVQAWKSQQARGAESHREEAGAQRDTPSLGEDLSG